MCGRFGLSQPEAVPDRFGAERLPEMSEHPAIEFPRFNVAPSQDVLVVARTRDGRNVVRPMRWGLVPYWTKDPAKASPSVNLRSETLFQKPSYRAIAERRRCLIPADGFYEWQKTGGRKLPWHLGLRSGEPFGFAGVWDYWRQGDTGIVSCAILTTSPNQQVARVHDRMPVILPRDKEQLWLDRAVHSVEMLMECTAPFPDELMAGYPVSHLVNDVRNEGPDLRLPAI